MANTARLLRQTLTIARRDFVATVFTPTFLLFLFAPIIMLSLSAVGGLSAASVGATAQTKVRIVAIVPTDRAELVRSVDERLRGLYAHTDEPPELVVETPRGDAAAQARALFGARDYDVAAAMFGDFAEPHILYSGRPGAGSDYLAGLAEEVLRTERTGTAALSHPIRVALNAPQRSFGGQNTAAFLTTFGLFFLTLLLAGQAVGTMAEERANKVIEVLAAAVPLEAVFLGKLIGMFGVAVLFVAFWGTIIGQIGGVIPPEQLANIRAIRPAIGWPLFAPLFVIYFAMAYMLLGAVFLSVGAQATTMREIQMLSLPITFGQVSMFGFAAAAAAHPGTWIATAAELFPLSSPFAMGAHAANSAVLWPHLLAIAWQLMWVSLVIAIGARAFRRGVLQSGSGGRGLRGLFRRA